MTTEKPYFIRRERDGVSRRKRFGIVMATDRKEAAEKAITQLNDYELSTTTTDDVLVSPLDEKLEDVKSTEKGLLLF